MRRDDAQGAPIVGVAHPVPQHVGRVAPKRRRRRAEGRDHEDLRDELALLRAGGGREKQQGGAERACGPRAARIGARAAMKR
jgi:hypothetical protein